MDILNSSQLETDLKFFFKFYFSGRKVGGETQKLQIISIKPITTTDNRHSNIICLNWSFFKITNPFSSFSYFKAYGSGSRTYQRGRQPNHLAKLICKLYREIWARGLASKICLRISAAGIWWVLTDRDPEGMIFSVTF